MILPRSGLIIAKVISVLVLELIQTVILGGVAVAFYDWRPTGGPLLAPLGMAIPPLTRTFASCGSPPSGA